MGLRSLAQRSLRSPNAIGYGLASIAGVLLALAFPLPGWSALAWFAPGLLWVSTVALKPSAAFRAGYGAGLLHFLVSLRWLLNMPFPAGAVAGWFALSAYMALYWGVWTWLLAHLSQGGSQTTETSPRARWIEAGRYWSSRGWMVRSRLAIFGACAWVALEMVRGRLMSGFPWNFLGVTQWRNSPLIQVASVTGVYGVSFLVCWGSICLVSALVLVSAQPQKKSAWMAEARVPLIAMILVCGMGFRRISNGGPHEKSMPRITVALVQPAIPQEVLWDKSQTESRFDKIFKLSQQAMIIRPDVLVWPEGCLDLDGLEPFHRILGLVTNGPASWILGAEDSSRGPDGRDRFFNAAWVFDERGRYVERYHKRRLVIFGEYVPLARWLPFLKWLTPIGGGFDSGTSAARFPVRLQSGEGTNDAVIASISPIICFEDIFPHGCWDHVQPDTDFILELTNDGWFSDSSAQWQHCANVALRSVENGVPLVRCANNGVTCWIDAYGRMRDRLGATPGEVYRAGFLSASVPLAAAGESRPLTPYHEHGDVFGWICVGLAGLVSVTGISRRGGLPYVIDPDGGPMGGSSSA